MKCLLLQSVVLALCLLSTVGCLSPSPPIDHGVLDDQPRTQGRKYETNPVAILGLWAYQVEGSRFLEQGKLEFFTTAHGLSGRLTEESSVSIDETRGRQARGRQALLMPIDFDEVHLAGNHLTFAGRAEALSGRGRLKLRVEAQVADWGRFTGRLSLRWFEGDAGLTEAATMEAQRSY